MIESIPSIGGNNNGPAPSYRCSVCGNSWCQVGDEPKECLWVKCPSNTAQGKWGTSSCGEYYEGMHETREDAIAENPQHRYIGQYRAPVMPWEAIHFDIDSAIENLYMHNDYGGEWAEDSVSLYPEQEEELQKRLKDTFEIFCVEQEIIPKFGLVESYEEITPKPEKPKAVVIREGTRPKQL